MLFLVTRAQGRAREAAERTPQGLRRSEEALRAANQARDERFRQADTLPVA